MDFTVRILSDVNLTRKFTNRYLSKEYAYSNNELNQHGFLKVDYLPHENKAWDKKKRKKVSRIYTEMNVKLVIRANRSQLMFGRFFCGNKFSLEEVPG